MLRTLFELGKTCALGFFLNDYIKRHYPEYYKNCVITVVYYFFYYYSQVEIFINKITNQNIKYFTEKYPALIIVVDDLKKFFTSNKVTHSDIEFIKNGKIINKVLKNQYLTLDDFENFNYDFIIYNDRSTVPNNVKIISNLSSNKEELKCLLENLDTYEYETSNIKFILAEISFNTKTYKIDFLTNKVNFYVKDNIFNYSFFLYYLRYYYEGYNMFNTDTDSVPEEITLNLIDQNANNFYMDLKNDTDYLVIQKDDYIIETLNKKNE